MPWPLSRQLLSHLGSTADGDDDLEQRLAAMVAAARQAFPDLTVPPEDFVRHIARHLKDPAPEQLAAELAELRGADLYLCCACAAGSPAALRDFERLLAQVPPALSRMAPSSAFVDEVLQVLRARLLVQREGAPPKIVEYAGRGPLLNWLRVAAVRAALDLRRGRDEKLDGGLSQVDAAPRAPAADMELQLLRHRYQAEFQQAFAAALSTLDASGRSVLRMHFLDGLTLPQVAAAVQVSRATATRWISAARRTVWEETERLLRQRLRLSESEFASLAGALRSQLDVSFSELMK